LTSVRGAVSFSNVPAGERIVGGTSTGDSWVELQYSRTVPATGAVALGFTYSTAGTYTVTLTATADGTTAPLRRVSFTIVG
jgi:hypothetical protein